MIRQALIKNRSVAVPSPPATVLYDVVTTGKVDSVQLASVTPKIRPTTDPLALIKPAEIASPCIVILTPMGWALLQCAEELSLAACP